MPDGYEAVIGLEIHVQLSTRTKMFCGCALSFGDEPNVHTCPICLAHPGSLPVVNEQAVRYGLQIGFALGCEIAPWSIFHRKNYFYPDNPKGYQISQYDIPLASAGTLAGVRIHRVHLEEDAAKMVHVGESGRIHGSASSLVDFNRGGTPLVEIVTEPDLRDPAQAREWAQLLRTTVKQLGVSDVNMEEGSLRCDANVSIRRAGERRARNEDRAEEHEQLPLPGARDRGRAGAPGRSGGGRGGGGAGDVPLRPSDRLAHTPALEGVRARLPLLPGARPRAAGAHRGDARARPAKPCPSSPTSAAHSYETELGVPEVTARQLAFDAELGEYFERAVQASADSGAADAHAAAIANWVTGELTARLRESGDGETGPGSSKVAPDALARLVGMVETKQVTTGAARTVLAAMVDQGGDPAEIVEREGLGQLSDEGELEAIVERAIEAEPAAAEKVRSGNPKAIGPIVGAVMRETKGRADGGDVTKLIREKLGAG